GLLDAAAIALRLLRVLNGIGLRVTAKVSGGKGVHCYVPLNTPADFRQTKDFARTVARRIERHYPDDVVSKMRKAAREGKVFIDWSQNDEYKTTVCPYSLRAGARPTVAAPVEWKELQHAVDRQDEDALRFTPADMAERLRDKGDLLHDVLTLRQRLPGAEPVRVEGLSTWTGEDNPRKGDPAEATDTDPEALAEYRRKRDFSGTPEPSGEQAGTADLVGTFVIQKHHATALHYDLRLECDGVLKSWAVPKGPSPDPDEKRLAVEVEDHPLEYARFEGRIPRGEYGGGSVVVWDRGAFEVPGAEARNDAVREGMKEGKLEFRLQGVKLQGRYLLVRTGKQSNGKPQWLLMKREDAAAQASVDPVETEPYSVISGLWVEDLQEAGEHGKQTRSK
ncbi:MAG: DNA polymerase ligase N-terminal domain-containing protein, partial [Phycisphaerae bacterium]